MGNRPPFETFKGATCKGCYALGSQCGSCEKCAWEREQMAQHPTPAPACEPDGDVVQEALRTFHSVPWGHRLASDELGDLGDRKWRDGMAAVVGMLQAKHDAELQSLREQHQKDMEMALGPVTDDEWSHIPGHFSGQRITNKILESRRALIAKDAPKEIEVPEGMAQEAHNEFFKAASLNGKSFLTDGQRLQLALKAALRWQRDNQPASGASHD